MKNISIVLFSLFFFTSLCAQEKLIRYEKIESFSKEDLKKEWKKAGLPQFISPVKNGIDLYELYYQTSLPNGKEVVATGLYYVPQNLEHALPLLQYNHGTTTRSRKGYDYNGESTICKIFATDGYAVAWQDYIGLGKAKGFHPYQHSQSTGQSGVDLLKAIREINIDLGVKLNHQLFISGYSQGGYSTMAVHKMIEEKYPNVFKVTATSPMSGAYDMTGVQSEVMNIPYTQPHYLPYLLYGYTEIYDILDGKPFSYIFKAPYDSIIPFYFDKKHSVSEINAILPEIPMDMIKPEFVKAYENDPNFKFTKALKENNLYNWIPQAPIQLCYCAGDEEVYYKNSLKAYDYMTSNGAKHIRKRNVGKRFSHRECADYATLYTKFYFDSFRNGNKNGGKGAFFKNLIVGMVKGMRKK